MYGKKLFLKKEFIFGGTSPDIKILTFINDQLIINRLQITNLEALLYKAQQIDLQFALKLGAAFVFAIIF